MNRIAHYEMAYSPNPLKQIKIWIWFNIVRRFYKPTEFFYFSSKHKTDFNITGCHWSGRVKYYRVAGEPIKAWTTFCFRMVYNSRNNKC